MTKIKVKNLMLDDIMEDFLDLVCLMIDIFIVIVILAWVLILSGIFILVIIKILTNTSWLIGFVIFTIILIPLGLWVYSRY